MGKRILLILVVALLCKKNRAMQLDSLHDVLYHAYIAESDSQANLYFKKAQKLIVDDSSVAYYNYFKFFYYLGKRSDSTKYYASIALPQLYKTKFYTEFFRIRNAVYWDYIDASQYDKAVAYGIENLEWAKKVQDTGRWIGYYADIAVAYHDIAEYQKAIETAQKGLRISTHPKFLFDRASCINAIGISFDDWGGS